MKFPTFNISIIFKGIKVVLLKVINKKNKNENPKVSEMIILLLAFIFFDSVIFTVLKNIIIPIKIIVNIVLVSSSDLLFVKARRKIR
ncbi:hypothetical protein D3C71_1671610 [compost metagenome]